MSRRIVYKELYAFYNSYEWEKCAYADFRRRAVTQKRPFELAIKPENLREPLSAEKLFYDNYQGEKCLKPTFISRVRSGLSFEEAISPVLIKPKLRGSLALFPILRHILKKYSLLEQWLISHSHQLKLKSSARNTKGWKLILSIGWLPANFPQNTASLSRSWNIFRRRSPYSISETKSDFFPLF